MATFFGIASGSVLTKRDPPVAKVVADPEVGVIGTVVRLDGTPSTSPGDLPLTYSWRFLRVPVGSMVAQEGFRVLDEDGGFVSFSPDLCGEYEVSLTVDNGAYSSSAATTVKVREILVPDGRGLIPDGKFVWSYIRDVWQGVENKEVFETLWSMLLQLTGSQLLRLYQVDFNKSIRDIQDKYQRRWISYEPKLSLSPDDVTMNFGGELAGNTASTELFGQMGKAVIISPNELIVVQGSAVADAVGPISILYSRSSTNVGKFELQGPNAAVSGYRLAHQSLDPLPDRVLEVVKPEFKFQSKVWSLGMAPPKAYALKMSSFPSPVDQLSTIFSFTSGDNKDVQPGDVIHMKTGKNQGFYRIKKVTGAYIEVDRAPPRASDPGDVASVYRPVGFKLPPFAKTISNTFSVPYSTSTAPLLDAKPGRLITVGGRAYTILQVTLDERQMVPSIVVTTDNGEVITGRVGLDWRLPSTLHSSSLNFEELGVEIGDTLSFDLIDGKGQAVEIDVQVVGVDGHRIGFVVGTDPVVAGTPYEVSDLLFAYAAQQLSLKTVTVSHEEMLLSGDARTLHSYLHSRDFRSKYWHRDIDGKTAIETPVGEFYVRPKHIIRNSKIPVDDRVLSVPCLQEWISQPQILERDGQIFQMKGEKAYPMDRRPVVLMGNNDYIIDDDVALDANLVFMTGSRVLEVEGASFIDRRIGPGDILTITTNPAIAGDYLISGVIDANKVMLAKPLPRTIGSGLVSAHVTVVRRKGGKFLRVIPGTFNAANPLPPRLWAEVTYFDNRDTIEGNFGILVGLTRDRLESVSSRVSYRQAVAGLMYAYTRGASIDKIRLGAQILLGLPFAEHRGIVRSIDKDYRLDLNGNPVTGRILVEDVDETDSPLGMQRIYLYPIDEISELAGVDTNPKTGKPYAVGDIVELFSPLAKGVSIDDYVSSPDSLTTGRLLLQRYHSFKMRANDMIFDLKEIELVSEFLKRITPSYVAFMLTDVTEVEDVIGLTDATTVRLKQPPGGLGLTDNIATAIQTPFVYDEINYNGRPEIFWELGPVKRRRSGVAQYHHGSRTVTVEAGGLLLDPSIDGAPAKVGDIFIALTGPWRGMYSVQALTDTTVTLNGTAPPNGLSDAVGDFMIVRKILPVLRQGVVTSVSGQAVVVETGLVTDGVMPGDWLVVGGKRYEIANVREGTPESNSWNTLDLLTAPTATAGDSYKIYRPQYIADPYEDEVGVLTSDGTSYTHLDNPYIEALMEPLDQFMVDEPGYPELLLLDAEQLAIVPVLPAGDYLVHLRKKRSVSSPQGFDYLENHSVIEDVRLKMSSSTEVTVALGDRVFPMGGDYEVAPRLGDVIVFMGKTYPVAALQPSSQSVALSRPLSDTGPGAWALLRRL